MHREQARIRTRKAQMAAGALLLGAVAVVAVPAGTPGAGSSPTDVPTASSAAAGVAVAINKPAAKSGEADIDALALSRALERIAPDLPPPRAKEPIKPDEGPAATPPPPPPAQWRYIGVVLGQVRSSHRAIVTVHEQQTLVSEGQQFEGDKVDEIHDTFMLVTSAAGVQRRVEMAVQAKPLLVVAPRPSTPGGASGHVELVDDQDAEALVAAKAAAESGDLARSLGLSEEIIKGYPPEALNKVLNALAPQEPGGRLGLTDGSGALGGKGGLDSIRLVQRRRIQALDEAFHNGTVTAAQYKQRMKALSEVSEKGTPEDQNRAIEQYIEEQLGPRNVDVGEPK